MEEETVEWSGVVMRYDIVEVVGMGVWRHNDGGNGDYGGARW